MNPQSYRKQAGWKSAPAIGLGIKPPQPVPRYVAGQKERNDGRVGGQTTPKTETPKENHP